MAELDRVRVWAEALIRMHLDPGWSFGFDAAKKRAGACDYAKRRITLSRYLAELHEDDDVHQTLLHEVAHAMAGHEAGHGPEWRRIAREIGYVGGATHRLEVATAQARWIGTCPNGHEIARFRRPGSRAVSCARCSRSFDRRYLVRWRERPEAELAQARAEARASARAARRAS